MWASKSCGGHELPVSEVIEIISEIAYYNASLAWVTGVTNCSSLITGFVNEEMCKHIYCDTDAMIGGFAGPSGLAEIADDQLRVTGRWSWGSGITHCSHIVGGVKLIKDKKVTGTGIVFLDPSEVTFHDNWHVLGLKGTRSIDYSAESAIIPKTRWTYFPVKEPINDSPLYRFSFLGALSVSVAAVGRGLAKRAISELTKIAKTKSPFGQGKPLADRSDFQEQLAKVQGHYQAADSLLVSSVQKAEEEALNGACSVSTKANIRLAAVHATSLNTEAVNTSYHLAGGSSIWKGSKIEEIFRDMNVVSQHGMVNRGNYRTAGAVNLDRDVPEVML